MTTHEHPWLAHLSGDDDGPPDVGDPRDMAVPTVVRGMSVRDEAAWAAEVNAAGKADGKQQTGKRMLTLGSYATTAAHMERIIRLGMEPEDAFRCENRPGAAEVLARHWIYGPRFWAWWQGRQTAKAETCPACSVVCRAPGPCGSTPCRREREKPDPSVLRLAAPITARVGDELVIEGERIRVLERISSCEFRVERETPKPTTNAHGVDVSRIAVGDYVRLYGAWRLVKTPGNAHGLVGVYHANPAIDPHGYAYGDVVITAHRPAPRITLPDGRDVVVERMWKATNELFADVAGGAWMKHGASAWQAVTPSLPWTGMGDHLRAWPPLDVEPA